MATEQPNIILVMTDQQRFDTISALGFPYMETPNLDRLVTEGVTLSQWVGSLSSSPAHTYLLTAGPGTPSGWLIVNCSSTVR